MNARGDRTKFAGCLESRRPLNAGQIGLYQENNNQVRISRRPSKSKVFETKREIVKGSSGNLNNIVS